MVLLLLDFFSGCSEVVSDSPDVLVEPVAAGVDEDAVVIGGGAEGSLSVRIPWSVVGERRSPYVRSQTDISIGEEN